MDTNVEVTEHSGFEENTEIMQPNYTLEEEIFRGEIIRQLNHAFNQRQQEFTELDGMTYDDYYTTNKKAANAYIPPKINKEDVRAVSGVTREKVNTLVSALLNYNLEADIMPYDELSTPDNNLGIAMEDLVRKSRKLEIPDYDVKRPLFYKELVEQGTVFILERYMQSAIPKKVITGTDMDTLKWKESVGKMEEYCCSELLNGLNVYLGNIREFYIENQPYIGIRFERTRSEAKAMYGSFERWKNVPRKVFYTASTTTNSSIRPYDNWTMVEMDTDMVEELWYMNKGTNTLQIMLNGTMMLKPGFPLSYLLGMAEYPIVKGDIEPISRYFAYSRSVPAKSKFNQAVMDEMYKAIILKTRKSAQPPMANFTGQTITKKIFYPATITNNIDPTKLQEIGTNNGATQAEFSALQLVKQTIDDSSVAAAYEGNPTKKRQTAREILELKQQSLQRLGMTIIGVTNLEKKMAWFRLNNILMNWTKPLDETIDDVKGKLKTYRTENIDTEFEDGVKGEHVIEFSDNVPEPSQVAAQSNIMSFTRGKVVRKTVINPEVLRSLKYRWFIEVSQSQKDTSELRAAMFEESVTKAKQIFQNQVNDEYAKVVWANYQKLDPKKFWLQNQQAPQMGGQPVPQEGGDQGGAQGQPAKPQLGKQMKPKGGKNPSLNSMLQGKG